MLVLKDVAETLRNRTEGTVTVCEEKRDLQGVSPGRLLRHVWRLPPFWGSRFIEGDAIGLAGFMADLIPWARVLSGQNDGRPCSISVGNGAFLVLRRGLSLASMKLTRRVLEQVSCVSGDCIFLVRLRS